MQQDPNTGALPKKKPITIEQAIKLLQRSQDYIRNKICSGRSCSECPMRDKKEPHDTVGECLFYPVELAYHTAMRRLEFNLRMKGDNNVVSEPGTPGSR